MKKGFTLIELLVVIAIIAILAAILFPVFAQAREKARASSCLSNTKQFGTALLLYMDDYDETYPRKTSQDPNDAPTDASYPAKKFAGHWVDWWFGGGQTATWMDYIFPYVKNTNMYICPSASKKAPGYGYNVCMQGLYNNSGDVNTWVPASQSMIKNTAETVCFGDSCQVNNNYGVTTFQPSFLWTEQQLKDHASEGAENYYKTNAGYKSGLRHNEGANFTMADGHAKYYKNGQGPLAVFSWNALGVNDPWWRITLQK